MKPRYSTTEILFVLPYVWRSGLNSWDVVTWLNAGFELRVDSTGNEKGSCAMHGPFDSPLDMRMFALGWLLCHPETTADQKHALTSQVYHTNVDAEPSIINLVYLHARRIHHVASLLRTGPSAVDTRNQATSHWEDYLTWTKRRLGKNVLRFNDGYGRTHHDVMLKP